MFRVRHNSQSEQECPQRHQAYPPGDSSANKEEGKRWGDGGGGGERKREHSSMRRNCYNHTPPNEEKKCLLSGVLITHRAYRINEVNSVCQETHLVLHFFALRTFPYLLLFFFLFYFLFIYLIIYSLSLYFSLFLGFVFLESFSWQISRYARSDTCLTGELTGSELSDL